MSELLWKWPWTILAHESPVGIATMVSSHRFLRGKGGCPVQEAGLAAIMRMVRHRLSIMDKLSKAECPREISS